MTSPTPKRIEFMNTKEEIAVIKEEIAVMKAFTEGKQIQVAASWNGWQFEDLWEPTWNWESNVYRVKPEKLEIWVNIYKDGAKYVYYSRTDADRYQSRIRCAHMVEI